MVSQVPGIRVMTPKPLHCTAVTLWAASCLFAQTPAREQVFALRDTTGLNAPNVKTEAVKYLGRECVRMTVEGEDHEGLLPLPGTDFQDGVIEVDIALKSATPPGVRFPGFVGIAFRARPDASHYEVFYLRPGNSDAADQAMRNHAVQYASEPAAGWYRLRREWPSVYESHAELAMETWTKVRVEVAGRAAKLYLNGSAKPSLVVDGLKGEDLHGAVAVGLHVRGSVFFQRANHAGRAAEPEKRIRCRRFVGDAVWKRCRRHGRVNGIAPGWKQSDWNVVRPTGRGRRDNRQLAEWLRGTLVRG